MIWDGADIFAMGEQMGGRLHFAKLLIHGHSRKGE